MTKYKFLFIYHPHFGSYALIRVKKNIDILPDEFKTLMPGHKNGQHHGVQIQQNYFRLRRLRKCYPEKFMNLDDRKEEIIEDIAYVSVIHFIAV